MGESLGSAGNGQRRRRRRRFREEKAGRVGLRSRRCLREGSGCDGVDHQHRGIERG